MSEGPMSGIQPVHHPWGEPSLRLTLMPRDTNAWGTIFGGVILSNIDLAGGVEARKHAHRLFVTVAMREVVFHEPVFVGDLVSFYTKTLRIGRTSITIKVQVEALRGETGRRVKVTEAEVIYVAMDETRRPTPILSEGGPETTGRRAPPRHAAPNKAARPTTAKKPRSPRR
jgi:acyl-CoA thioesterase YciA